MILAEHIDLAALRDTAAKLLDEGLPTDDVVEAIADAIDDVLVWGWVPIPGISQALEALDGPTIRLVAGSIVARADRLRSRPEARRSLMVRVLAEVRGDGGQDQLRRRLQRLRAERTELARELDDARAMIRQLSGERRVLLPTGRPGGQG